VAYLGLVRRFYPHSVNEPQTSSPTTDEYYKLIDMVQGYDSYFVTIKSWSATASGAALGLAFVHSLWFVAFIAAVLALSFWITEARFKVLQLNHIKRASAVEKALRSGTPLASPAILASFGEASAAHHQSKTWRRVMAWPHVMFPHVTFFVFGIAGTIWLARR